MIFPNTLTAIATTCLQIIWLGYMAFFLLVYMPVRKRLGRWAFVTLLTMTLLVCYTVVIH